MLLEGRFGFDRDQGQHTRESKQSPCGRTIIASAASGAT
jgi:hypothetical protein